VVLVANLLVRWMDLGSSGYSPLRSLPAEAWKILGLDEGALEPILLRTRLEVDEWKTTLGLSLPERSAGPREGKDPDEPASSPGVWVVAPRVGRLPSLESLLRVSGYQTHLSLWGDRLLDLAGQIPHRAMVMDLRGAHVEEEKLMAFLRSLRFKSPEPILILASNGTSIPPSLEQDRIHSYRGAPHCGVLDRWLQKVLNEQPKHA
jgi:hypothetical protein